MVWKCGAATGFDGTTGWRLQAPDRRQRQWPVRWADGLQGRSTQGCGLLTDGESEDNADGEAGHGGDSEGGRIGGMAVPFSTDGSPRRRVWRVGTGLRQALPGKTLIIAETVAKAGPGCKHGTD